jgi:hypothetical protein
MSNISGLPFRKVIAFPTFEQPIRAIEIKNEDSEELPPSKSFEVLDNLGFRY